MYKTLAWYHLICGLHHALSQGLQVQSLITSSTAKFEYFVILAVGIWALQHRTVEQSVPPMNPECIRKQTNCLRPASTPRSLLVGNMRFLWAPIASRLKLKLLWSQTRAECHPLCRWPLPDARGSPGTNDRRAPFGRDCHTRRSFLRSAECRFYVVHIQQEETMPKYAVWSGHSLWVSLEED